MTKKKILIMGAAGRDFHNFNLCYRDDAGSEVVAFTATQIPYIDERRYPPELSGALYPKGIPIYPEEELARLIKEHAVDDVVFSYSDVPHRYVMHKASEAIALGANFVIPSATKTMLTSSKPVISVCAVRTGCGKSGVTRFVAEILQKAGKKVVAIRHPMPYGDLAAQAVQRFTTLAEMKDAECTIEEMEEYEHLVDAGVVVYAGVDYGAILKAAEAEADVIIWDGGNNDLPFIQPDLEIVVADPMRPGHESLYHPGEANMRRAEVLIINKVNSAEPDNIALVCKAASELNPTARIIETASTVVAEDSASLKGKKVLVVEDGPTLTHGGMTLGAGIIAARQFGAEPIDPRPYAVGTLKATYAKYPKLTDILPAMGYSDEQRTELSETINAAPVDFVLIATPVDLSRIIEIKTPAIRVRYSIEDTSKPGLNGVITDFIKTI
jgi:predicted GTPase